MKCAIAIFAALAATAVAAVAHDADHASPPVYAGPADAYVYQLAAPGTYSLPAIRPAADAALLDETGAEVSLAQIFEGRITVLAFIYTRCGDICPIASARMADLQAMAAEDVEIGGDVSLVSLSFDPAHDTPARMAEYAANFRDPDLPVPPWLFLTAPDDAANAKVIEAYRQPVVRKRDASSSTGPLSHLLRVFLIDNDGIVRNIYSADFFDPRLVVNDIRTLRMDTGAHD